MKEELSTQEHEQMLSNDEANLYGKLHAIITFQTTIGKPLEEALKVYGVTEEQFEKLLDHFADRDLVKDFREQNVDKINNE